MIASGSTTSSATRLMNQPMSARPKPGRHQPIFLKEWRTRRGLNQELLGNLVGVDKAQVSNWESGRRRPSNQSQSKIAAALNIEIADLYRDPGKISIDELLRDKPPEFVKQVYDIVMVLINKSG